MDTATAAPNENITYTPIKPLVGSTVEGIDLAAPLSEEAFAELRRQMCDRGVLILKNQDMTPAEQIAFSKRFGELEHHVLQDLCLPGHPEIFVVSNIIEDGKKIGAYDGSRIYHIDCAYLEKPSMGSVFYCLEHPEEGGQTVAINLAAVYEALDDDMKKFLEGRTVVRDYVWHYERNHADRTPLTPEQRAKTPPIEHPAVVSHPETGKNILFIDAMYCRRFGDMSEEDSRPIFKELMDFADQDQFKVVHTWTVGDVMIWDNRGSVHKRLPFDLEGTRRRMHRTTVMGERPAFNG
ncbi:MAG: TauD/TfdA dioxygenase family protein [Rhodospirillales bacterium]|jgi:taurine dioxygenase